MNIGQRTRFAMAQLKGDRIKWTLRPIFFTLTNARPPVIAPQKADNVPRFSINRLF